jgi:hypothetical protein
MEDRSEDKEGLAEDKSEVKGDSEDRQVDTVRFPEDR